MLFLDRVALVACAHSFEGVALALRGQDRPRLLRRFVHADDDEPRLGFRIGVGVRGRLEDSGRAIHGVDLGFEPPGQVVFDRRFDGEFFRADQVADGVPRPARSGLFLDREHLVFERVLALVKERPVGERREFDQLFLRAQRQDRVLHVALARARSAEDLQSERVGHFPAGHGEVAHELVGGFSDEAEPFQVAEDLIHEVGVTPHPHRFQFVAFGNDGASR